MTPAAPPAPDRRSSGNGHAQPVAPPPPPPPARAADRELARRRAAAGGPAARPRRSRRRSSAAPSRRRPRPRRPRPSSTSRPRSCCGCPEGDPAKGEVLHQAVEPGQRERVLALIRNQSGIVDNYDLRIEGMPEDWYSIFPGDRVPGAVRRRRHVRAGGRGPPASAARPGGRGAGVGPEGRRRLEGAPGRRRDGAAGAAHPALHRDVDDAAPAAQEGPPQGGLRRHGRQQGERAGADRARRRGSRRRDELRVQPAAAGDPRGRVGEDADAGAPAEADLDRPRAGPAARGQDGHAARRRPRARRPSR